MLEDDFYNNQTEDQERRYSVSNIISDEGDRTMLLLSHPITIDEIK